MRHGDLVPTNILLSRSGDVKIAKPECCHKIDTQTATNVADDMSALRNLMLGLMEKDSYSAEGPPTLRNPDKWSEAIVDFVALTRSTAINVLAKVSIRLSWFDCIPSNAQQHEFLQRPRQKEDLVRPVIFASISAYRVWAL